MPRRHDIQKILIIGSGPIVIGQGCEFDYSGVQACRALKKAGYEIVLINSNPATIMTDPELADHTYIEPINWQNVTRIIAKEQPHALLSTMGGQTALNCALELDKRGILQQYNVELIGAKRAAIETAEDRELFRIAMQELGLDMARSIAVSNMPEALVAQQELGFPIIIRPSFTLGGSGGGVARNQDEFISICEHGFALSMNHQLLIEESLLGWKEYELEVVRDLNDTCIIVCSIENLDPMGVHTGDSITVAPAQTLTDKEYQKMRNAAIAILRKIGVETGGSNVQFAVEPNTGRMVVIEMNPRVSRSSALASKATGFPIAKIAALLAVGYTLDELSNDITGGLIPASFEPTLDYVVVKIPRFNFDKFPQVSAALTTQMQAIGEVMAIGSTFAAACQKALCSLEIDIHGFDNQIDLNTLTHAAATAQILQELNTAGPLRLLYVADAFRLGLSIHDIHKNSAIDVWFLDQIQNIVALEQNIARLNPADVSREALLYWKQQGFSDKRLACLLNTSEDAIRNLRNKFNINSMFKRIDSCAAEFPAKTAYLYATFEGECEALPTQNKKVIVLGSGPNRIGQGVEFDYCCVHAVQALQQNGIEAIMINCNPETVSTDYDISDRLYFEALTLETVLEIVKVEQPLGVILQLGGQTPLKLAAGLQANNVRILGTAPDMIDLAEDRGRFVEIIKKLQLKQPDHALIYNLQQALTATQELGYPLMVRPSYVLGGRAMEIVYNDTQLQEYLHKAFTINPNNAVLIDRYLQSAIEVDVDVLADGKGQVLVAGIMEHVEPAGVHSGDSAAVMPPHTLSTEIQNVLRKQARTLALELNIVGLMNIQFAVQDSEVFVLEVNPRASRTVPFVSKSIGMPIAKMAVACMLGKALALNIQIKQMLVAVKQAVFPFIKFAAADPLLGPEMRSTGEIMSFGANFASAYKKSLAALGYDDIKQGGCSFVMVNDSDKIGAKLVIDKLVGCGCKVLVCSETAGLLGAGLGACFETVSFDRVISLISDGKINLVVSTRSAKEADWPRQIRSCAIRHRVMLSTTINGALAFLNVLENELEQQAASNAPIIVYKLQDLHSTQVVEYEY